MGWSGLARWAWSSVSIRDLLKIEVGETRALLDMEGFLMPKLSDLVQAFPHPSQVDGAAPFCIHECVI